MKGKYATEYCDAKIKYQMLKNESNSELYDIPWNLSFYVKNIKPKWVYNEWGFPKGRRDKRTEENISCARREFEEETGYQNQEYTVLNKVEPIEEILFGTNTVKYKHIYYLAIDDAKTDDYLKRYDTNEIGDIKWFTFEDAMAHIRPYHFDKKKILTKIYLFILNYLIHN